jgi:RHS repeat-associated protein
MKRAPFSRFAASAAACLLGLVVAGAARADKSGVRPNVISVPSGPGTISGLGEQFEPALNTGSATYAVTLEAAPGTAGVTPNLALRYDSGQGNGTVGLGWSLDVGSIQRQTDHGVPRYDGSDRYLWNGQELVPLGGGVFRLKIEGAYLRFREMADHWEADGPDGTLYRFGVSADARVTGTAGVFRWGLQELVDVSGNRIAFGYASDGGQLYLARVDYNLRPGAARGAVQLDYEARSDALTDYRAGFAITTARRLKTVRMTMSGGAVRRYELAYEAPSATSALSKLAGVTMFGADDHTALPSLTFGYTGFDPAAAHVTAVVSPPAFALTDANTELADFDGDGLPDLVHTKAGRHEVALNRGASWSAAAALPTSPSVDLAATGTQLADLDGDGIADLVAKLAPGTGDFVYFPNRGVGRWEAPVRFTNNPDFSFEDPGVRMLDFDGDGLVDVVQTTPTELFSWRNNGDGTWAAPLVTPPPAGAPPLFTDPQVQLADMNGDRLLDLARVQRGAVTYWPNEGWGHWGAAITLGGSPDAGADEARVQLADANGDGLTDAVLVAGTGVQMWLQRGDGTFAPPLTFNGLPDSDPSRTVVRLADMNGSGTLDVVWNTPSASATEAWRYLDLAGGVRPNLLSAIDNGIGRTIEIAYSSSGAMSLAASAAGQPWTQRLPIPTQVVGSVTTSDGRGWSKQEAFLYRDGYFDGPTRQFRGFGQTTRFEPGDDDDATSVQVHRFDVGETEETLKGAELSAETDTVTGAVLVRETSTFEVRVHAVGLDGRTVASADRRRLVVDHIEGTTTPISTREDWSYDDTGDVLVHAEWGIIDGANLLAGADERVTTAEYASDPDRWILGRAAHVTTTDAAGTRLAETRTYYDGEPFVGAPLGVLGARGLPTRTESWVEGERFIDTTRLQRDEFGLVVATLDPRGFRHEVDYDADSHRFPVAERRRLADGGGLTLSATYDPVTGALQQYSDAAGTETRFAYTPLLQLAAIAKPGDLLDQPTLAFDYVTGVPLSQIITRSRVDGSATLEKHHFYDGLGRELGVVESANGGKTVASGLKVFGPNGRVVRELEPSFATGWVLPDSAAGTVFSSHRYDALGRRTRSVLPDGSASETRYAPFRAEHWDAEDLDPASPHAGTPRVEHESALGTIETDETLGGRLIATSFQRDALGRLAGVVDAAGNTTTYVRDGLGRLTSRLHPDAGRTTFVYDDAGNEVLQTDARGATVATTFDGINRPLTETLTNAAAKVEESVTYHYDAPSVRFPGDTFERGELTSVEDAAGVEHYRHDARGRLVEMIRSIDGVDYHLLLEHDELDRLASVIYPDGRRLEYHYDERGQLRDVPGILRDVQYDARGMPVRREYANGTVATADYDVTDRLRALSTTAGPRTLQSLSYGYDRTGNLTSIADAVHATGDLSATRTFAYDDLYRLRSAAGGTKPWSYDFDDVGNWRTKSDLGAYAYGADAHHRPSAAGGGAYAFDEAGEMVARPHARQTFDAKGRLASVTLDDGTVVTTRYDFSGAATVKETTGPHGHHRTVYIDRLAEERDGHLVDYVFAGGLRIARLGGAQPTNLAAGIAQVPRALGAAGMLALLLSAVLGLGGRSRGRHRRWARTFAALGLCGLMLLGGCRDDGATGGSALTASLPGAVYYHHDHLDGVALETDDHGNVLTESAFDPYGGDLHASTEPYAYGGKERDPATGLYDFGARAYDPKVGLFLSPDPAVLGDPELAIGDPQVLNPYTYTRNNPTSHVDPDGRFLHIAVGALIGAGIGAGAYLVKSAFVGGYSSRGMVAATTGGAVSGAIAAATGGVSIIVEGAAAGISGGLVERGINTQSLSKTFDPKSMATDAVAGVASGVAKQAASAAIGRLAPVAKAAIARARGGEIADPILRYSQKSASWNFQVDGDFKGRSIGGVAEDLRTGALSPSEVPVGTVSLDGNMLIVNTRSATALSIAKVPQSEWKLVDLTATDAKNISDRLVRNKLTTAGTSTVRINGPGPASHTLK